MTLGTTTQEPTRQQRRQDAREARAAAAARQRLATSLANQWKPEAVMTVSEWADSRRFLTTEESPAPGKWRTSRTPYLREPMDRLSITDPTPRVVLWFGSQLGKTEVGQNWTGYVMDVAPGPMMMLRPSRDDCQDFATQRLNHLLESPTLAGRVHDARVRDSTQLVKQFPGGVLFLVGANSFIKVSSKPIRYLFTDEADRCNANVGSRRNEGDVVAVTRKRLSQYGDRAKELITSTAVWKGASRIEREWEDSSQAWYHVPCPHCGKYDRLEFRDESTGEFRLRWDGDPLSKDGFHAWYVCPHCEGEVQEHQRTPMLAAGRWVHTYPDRLAKGYRLSTLYSPVGGVSWAQLGREWLAAIRQAESGDTGDLQAFVNTRLAQTWEDRTTVAVDPVVLQTRYVEDPWAQTSTDAKPVVADAAVAVTIGVDVQDDRLEYEVVAWGPGYESWSLRYGVIGGDPVCAEVWDELDKELVAPWRKADGTTLYAVASGVNMAGHRDDEVYKFCRARKSRRCWPMRGARDINRPVWDRKTYIAKAGQKAYMHVGVNAAKDSLSGLLKVTRRGPGYQHFPKDRDPDWFRQLTAERKVTLRSQGRTTFRWECPKGRRNEALDCRVYAFAALRGWEFKGHRLRPGVVASAPEPELLTPATGALSAMDAAGDPDDDSRDGASPTRPAAPRVPPPGRSGGGWLRGRPTAGAGGPRRPGKWLKR